MTTALRYPWDIEPPATRPPAAPPAEAPAPKPRGRRPASRTRAAEPVADWLYHHLTVSGPTESLTAFAAAARGSGIIPWRLDFAAIEEDIFIRAVSQPPARRGLSVDGCRILARQFRERMEAHHARAAALANQTPTSRGLACPFDLHALLPVPPAILHLGPTDPTALAWLRTHWGITDRLRQVVLRDGATMRRRLPQGHSVTGYGFFTYAPPIQLRPAPTEPMETPHAAIASIAQNWPALRFLLQPRPAT